MAGIAAAGVVAYYGLQIFTLDPAKLDLTAERAAYFLFWLTELGEKKPDSRAAASRPPRGGSGGTAQPTAAVTAATIVLPED